MMHARMLSIAFALAAAVSLPGLTGCVQRTITVNSDPQGALVYLNDIEIGRTPVTVPILATSPVNISRSAAMAGQDQALGLHRPIIPNEGAHCP